MRTREVNLTWWSGITVGPHFAAEKTVLKSELSHWYMAENRQWHRVWTILSTVHPLTRVCVCLFPFSDVLNSKGRGPGGRRIDTPPSPPSGLRISLIIFSPPLFRQTYNPQTTSSSPSLFYCTQHCSLQPSIFCTLLRRPSSLPVYYPFKLYKQNHTAATRCSF